MWDFLLCQILTGLTMDGHCLQTLLAVSRGFMFVLFPAAPSHLPYPVTQLLRITAAVCLCVCTEPIFKTGWPSLQKRRSNREHTHRSIFSTL